MKTSIIILILLFAVSAGFSEPIVLAAVNWEPYTSDNLPHGGIMGEIAEEAFRRAGYELLIEFVPWSRAIEFGKTGKYDGLIGVYYTDNRNKFFHFSTPVCDTDICFFTLKDNPQTIVSSYRSLSDLDGYSIGVINGFSYGAEFDHHPFGNLDISNSMEINIKKLLDGRIDIIVESRENFIYYMNLNHKETSGNIKELSPVLTTNTAYIALSRQNKDHDTLIEAINSALKSMQQDGTMRKIVSKTKDYMNSPKKYIRRHNRSE